MQIGDLNGILYHRLLLALAEWAILDHNASIAITQKREHTEMSTPAPETKIVDSFRVACDGGEGALGHPRVWLQIPDQHGWVECPYCDAKLVHKEFEGKV